jgi:arylsulfatase A-like enzyme
MSSTSPWLEELMTTVDHRQPSGQKAGSPEEERPPNVVIILADDLGFSDVGCYGSEIPTPAIDSLARHGLRFSQMYNSARCCPSRAALLTGLHPHQAGIGHMTYTTSETNPAYQGFLNDSCVTIAQPLKAAGYRTLMSGKWHVARQRKMSNRSSWPDDRPGYPLPRERGFDEFFGTIGGAGSYYKPTYLMENDDLIEQKDPSWFYTDAITDRGIEMVDGALADDMPFFLYMAYTAPHWPLHAFEEDVANIGDRYRSGWDKMRTARHEELKANGILDPKWDISARDPDAWPWDEALYLYFHKNRPLDTLRADPRFDALLGDVLGSWQASDDDLNSSRQLISS